jgi:hypothetical protein
MHIKFWFGNPEGKTALGRSRRRWEDNIKQILRNWGWRMRTGFVKLRLGIGVRSR